MFIGNLFIFVNCQITNPAFDSQTKDTLTTKPPKFGSVCTLSQKFLNSMADTGIVELVVKVASAKEEAKLKRLGGGKKKRVLIDKLDDANNAGRKDAELCTLIVTEGDSAKTLADAGLAEIGRDYFGVFPLRGKFLNVRDATTKQIMSNKEILNLLEIFGLKIGTKYDDKKGLRYGALMVMADQDHDGSHIKGLIINFVHKFWPSLIKQNDFVKQFATPIIKAK
jgi:DNA topoisomerase-2